MRKHTLIAFIAGVGLTLAAVFAAIGAIGFAAGDQEEVRVQARQLADGRVEVAVQHRDGPEADWHDRILPDRRFLRADADAGRWFSSSPVAARPAAATVAAAPDLYCLVTHAHPHDDFWTIAAWAASPTRWPHGLNVDVRMVGSPDAAEQSRLIRQCTADGATALGVTLANPDAVEAAVREAIDAGVWVVSFNSGLNHFERIGSLRHVGIDEQSAGAQAAAQFAAADVAGPALCVIHEAENVGLEERCDGFEAAWAGSVERLRVHATGVADLEGTAAAIANSLRSADPPIAAVLTLNHTVSAAAVDAIAATQSSAALGTFDADISTYPLILEGKILFALDTAQFVQAFLALSAMRNLATSGPGLARDFGTDDVAEVLGAIPILIGPRLRTIDNSQEIYDVQTKIAEARRRAAQANE